MKFHWVRVRKVEQDGETMYEARCDMFPDAAVFENTADDAYQAMHDVIVMMLEAYVETFGKVPGKV